jgi:hypothetical protein
MLISIKGDRSAQKRSAHVPAFVASSHGVSTLYDNLTAPYGCETSPNHYDRMLTAHSGDIKGQSCDELEFDQLIQDYHGKRV